MSKEIGSKRVSGIFYEGEGKHRIKFNDGSSTLLSNDGIEKITIDKSEMKIKNQPWIVRIIKKLINNNNHVNRK